MTRDDIILIEEWRGTVMDFQTKIVNAMVQVEKGCSLKDFLDDEEIIEALAMLADILVITGVLPTEEA